MSGGRRGPAVERRTRRAGRSGRLAAAAALALLAALLALRVGLKASRPSASAGAPEPAFRLLDASTLWLGPAALAEAGTATAAVRDFPLTLDVQGTIAVVENRVDVVSCRVNAGRVDRVFRVSGDTVRAGDPLALLYSPDYVSAREEYLLLRSGGGGAAGSGGDLDGLVGDARQRLLNMGLTDADIARLPGAGDQHLVVRAPRSGVLLSVNTLAGNLQNLGDTLFTIADLRQVWFVGDLYLEDLPKVHVGQRVAIRAEGLSKPLEGRLSFISPVVDPNAHTVKVRALIANPDRLLKPDLYVQGEVLLADPRALLVPDGAVLRTRGRAFCFLSQGGGRFREAAVGTGRDSGGWTAVTAGLKPGDRVLASELDTFDRVLDSARNPD